MFYAMKPIFTIRIPKYTANYLIFQLGLLWIEMVLFHRFWITFGIERTLQNDKNQYIYCFCFSLEFYHWENLYKKEIK